jgi:ribonuclease P protein component
MPSIGRLKKRPDFLKVAAARSKLVTPGLILQARQRSAPVRAGEGVRPASGQAVQPPAGPAAYGEGPEVRVGFTVSRKVGNAVQRNRARRRLRAVARAILPDCGRAGTDYVLIGRRATLERPYGALSGDLREALERVGKSGQSRRNAAAVKMRRV